MTRVAVTGGRRTLCAGRELRVDYVMNNNFAFCGENTSMIFRRRKR